ncbi:MAG: hypothetical protein A3E87_01010 [Gammaproteobacteria bacterium RIFCSPHIGHO2_12_FULL_35_23]|nr:MAG: hypothetical protein A3E87_01010 [Gammaproteobacteria bacterium RIFCSPHIGHO2_12_FULL_35_23]
MPPAPSGGPRRVRRATQWCAGLRGWFSKVCDRSTLVHAAVNTAVTVSGFLAYRKVFDWFRDGEECQGNPLDLVCPEPATNITTADSVDDSLTPVEQGVEAWWSGPKSALMTTAEVKSFSIVAMDALYIAVISVTLVPPASFLLTAMGLGLRDLIRRCRTRGQRVDEVAQRQAAQAEDQFIEADNQEWKGITDFANHTALAVTLMASPVIFYVRFFPDVNRVLKSLDCHNVNSFDIAMLNSGSDCSPITFMEVVSAVFGGNAWGLMLGILSGTKVAIMAPATLTKYFFYFHPEARDWFIKNIGNPIATTWHQSTGQLLLHAIQLGAKRFLIVAPLLFQWAIRSALSSAAQVLQWGLCEPSLAVLMKTPLFYPNIDPNDIDSLNYFPPFPAVVNTTITVNHKRIHIHLTRQELASLLPNCTLDAVELGYAAYAMGGEVSVLYFIGIPIVVMVGGYFAARAIYDLYQGTSKVELLTRIDKQQAVIDQYVYLPAKLWGRRALLTGILVTLFYYAIPWAIRILQKSRCRSPFGFFTGDQYCDQELGIKIAGILGGSSWAVGTTLAMIVASFVIIKGILDLFMHGEQRVLIQERVRRDLDRRDCEFVDGVNFLGLGATSSLLPKRLRGGEGSSGRGPLQKVEDGKELAVAVAEGDGDEAAGERQPLRSSGRGGGGYSSLPQRDTFMRHPVVGGFFLGRARGGVGGATVMPPVTHSGREVGVVNGDAAGVGHFIQRDGKETDSVERRTLGATLGAQ